MKILESFYLTLLIATFIAHTSCLKCSLIEAETYEFQPKSLSNTIGVLNNVSNNIEILKRKSSWNYLPIDLKEQIHNENIQKILSALIDIVATIKYANTMKFDTPEHYFHQVINTFAGVESPFHQFPTIALPILLAMPTLVESSMKIRATSKSGTEIACNLADTIETYFTPILLKRLNHINIEADYFKFASHNKYVFMKKMANQKFNPKVSKSDDNCEVNCVIGPDGNDGYQRAINAFGGYKTYYSNHRKIYEANKDKFENSFMKDGLGYTDTYYQDSDESCVMSYYSMVRARLERAFGEPYKKAKKLCKTDSQNRKKIPTGKGLLTITVGALLAISLPDDVPCDTGIEADIFCDPYVRITVGGKKYETRRRVDSANWISLDETINYPNLDRNAKIRIEILDADTAWDDTILSKEFDIDELLSNVLFEGNNYNLLMISTWKDEIEDTNFDRLVHSS